VNGGGGRDKGECGHARRRYRDDAPEDRGERAPSLLAYVGRTGGGSTAGAASVKRPATAGRSDMECNKNGGDTGRARAM